MNITGCRLGYMLAENLIASKGEGGSEFDASLLGGHLLLPIECDAASFFSVS